jgi:hypothetical protein
MARMHAQVDEEPYRTLTFSKVESREFIEFQGTYKITEPTSDGGCVASAASPCFLAHASTKFPAIHVSRGLDRQIVS